MSKYIDADILIEKAKEEGLYRDVSEHGYCSKAERRTDGE